MTRRCRPRRSRWISPSSMTLLNGAGLSRNLPVLTLAYLVSARTCGVSIQTLDTSVPATTKLSKKPSMALPHGYASRQGTGCFRSSKMRREVDAKVLLPCHYWTAFHVDKLIDIARISNKFWRSENNACPDAFPPSESRCGVYHRGNLSSIS